MNLLNKTKTYLVGHMEYADGSNWREYVKNQLTPLGITIFNPYDKPFIKDVDEGVNIGFALESNYIKETVNKIASNKLNQTLI